VLDELIRHRASASITRPGVETLFPPETHGLAG
jgi:hypothetical protein